MEKRDKPKPHQVIDYLKLSTTGTRTLEDLSLTSSEESLDPSAVPGAPSTETASNCMSHTKLGSETDSGFCTPATSTKLVLYVCFTIALQQGDLTCLCVFSFRPLSIYGYNI